MSEGIVSMKALIPSFIILYAEIMHDRCVCANMCCASFTWSCKSNYWLVGIRYSSIEPSAILERFYAEVL